MESAEKSEEALAPQVRAILDDVVIKEDGLAFVNNYVDWVMTLRKLPAKEHSRVFVQLAVLARQFSAAGCKPVASSLASLARIGLGRLAKPKAPDGPR